MQRHFRLGLLVALAILGALTFVVPTFAAPGSTDPSVAKDLANARQATHQYHDVDNAVADGFVPTEECVSSPAGTMGQHFVNFARFDPTLNLLEPEVLLYVPQGSGEKLVAIEYVQLLLANLPGGVVGPWFDPVAPPPLGFATPVGSILGQTLNGPMPGHEPGMPWHAELHVWAWQANPDGIFADWNTKVDCQ